MAGIQNRLEAILEKTLRQALELGVKVSRDRLSPGGGGPVSRSGALRDSIGFSITRSKEGFKGEITSSSPYAMVHENGATIFARKAAFLRFRAAGGWAMKKSVRIPPRPFIKPGLDAAAANFDQLLEQNMKELWS